MQRSNMNLINNPSYRETTFWTLYHWQLIVLANQPFELGQQTKYYLDFIVKKPVVLLNQTLNNNRMHLQNDQYGHRPVLLTKQPVLFCEDQ